MFVAIFIHNVSHLTHFFYSPYFVTRGMLMHHEPLCLYTLTQHSVLDFMELTIACLDREGGL